MNCESLKKFVPNKEHTHTHTYTQANLVYVFRPDDLVNMFRPDVTSADWALKGMYSCSLRTLYLLACQVRATVDDWGLCGCVCVPCIKR